MTEDTLGLNNVITIEHQESPRSRVSGQRGGDVERAVGCRGGSSSSLIRRASRTATAVGPQITGR